MTVGKKKCIQRQREVKRGKETGKEKQIEVGIKAERKEGKKIGR